MPKGILERIFSSGKRTEDIHLPNESGIKDPRLKDAPSLRKSLGKMKKGLRTLREKQLILKDYDEE